MQAIKNAAKATVFKAAEYAKAVTAAVSLAALPELIDLVTNLSASDDRLVAAIATVVLVYLVPNKKPA